MEIALLVLNLGKIYSFDHELYNKSYIFWDAKYVFSAMKLESDLTEFLSLVSIELHIHTAQNKTTTFQIGVVVWGVVWLSKFKLKILLK